MANSIAASTLTEGRTIIVRGRIQYSHVMSMIEGEALQRSIQQQRNNGSKFPTDKPHTRIVLENAQIIAANPNNLTLEEQYVQNRFYNSKKNPGVVCFSMDNKSPFLPPVWVPKDANDPSQGHVQLTDPEGELDNGLDVSLILETFQVGDNPNRGIGLNAIVVNEAVRYYSNDSLDRDYLAKMGIILNGPSVTPTYNIGSPAGAEQGQGQGQSQGQNQSGQDQYSQNGLPAPGIGQQPNQPAQAPQQGFQGQGNRQAGFAPQSGQQFQQPQAQGAQQGAQQGFQGQGFPAQSFPGQGGQQAPQHNQTAFDPSALPQFQGQQPQQGGFDPEISDPWAPINPGANQPGITF